MYVHKRGPYSLNHAPHFHIQKLGKRKKKRGRDREGERRVQLHLGDLSSLSSDCNSMVRSTNWGTILTLCLSFRVLFDPLSTFPSLFLCTLFTIHSPCSFLEFYVKRKEGSNERRNERKPKSHLLSLSLSLSISEMWGERNSTFHFDSLLNTLLKWKEV